MSRFVHSQLLYVGQHLRRFLNWSDYRCHNPQKAHLLPLRDVSVQFENKFKTYAPETRLLVYKLFWLRDIGNNVGQTPRRHRTDVLPGYVVANSSFKWGGNASNPKMTYLMRGGQALNPELWSFNLNVELIVNFYIFLCNPVIVFHSDLWLLDIPS